MAVGMGSKGGCDTAELSRIHGAQQVKSVHHPHGCGVDVELRLLQRQQAPLLLESPHHKYVHQLLRWARRPHGCLAMLDESPQQLVAVACEPTTVPASGVLHSWQADGRPRRGAIGGVRMGGIHQRPDMVQLDVRRQVAPHTRHVADGVGSRSTHRAHDSAGFVGVTAQHVSNEGGLNQRRGHTERAVVRGRSCVGAWLGGERTMHGSSRTRARSVVIVSTNVVCAMVRVSVVITGVRIAEMPSPDTVTFVLTGDTNHEHETIVVHIDVVSVVDSIIGVDVTLWVRCRADITIAAVAVVRAVIESCTVVSITL